MNYGREALLFEFLPRPGMRTHAQRIPRKFEAIGLKTRVCNPCQFVPSENDEITDVKNPASWSLKAGCGLRLDYMSGDGLSSFPAGTCSSPSTSAKCGSSFMLTSQTMICPGISPRFHAGTLRTLFSDPRSSERALTQMAASEGATDDPTSPALFVTATGAAPRIDTRERTTARGLNFFPRGIQFLGRRIVV